MTSAAAAFASLARPMQLALESALEAMRAGSLGIGATIVRSDGEVVSRGRNRLHESDPGDDAVAGTSLAHAEINALSKLRFRAHEGDELVLHTTLQPCVQCLGAIRLGPVREVVILAPDPLWIGIEGLRAVSPFVGQRWPEIGTLPASPWSVFALVSPTRHALGHPRIDAPWRERLPATSELAAALDPTALGDGSIVEVVTPWWDDLATCVDEVEQLAVESRRHQT